LTTYRYIEELTKGGFFVSAGGMKRSRLKNYNIHGMLRIQVQEGLLSLLNLYFMGTPSENGKCRENKSSILIKSAPSINLSKKLTYYGHFYGNFDEDSIYLEHLQQLYAHRPM